jgi:2-oxo-4-hydroxy-4-carboxy--5-ureidoimidazoline (OHCU) decarboxylase
VSQQPGSMPWMADFDKLPDARAIASLAPLFEGAPRFLLRLISERPFWSWDRLFDRAREIAHGMPQPEQIELLDAHPRLGAPAGSVSELSAREQGLGSSDPRKPGQAQVTATELARLNDAYERRFGFRYCVFVAGRPLAALLPGFASALAGERDPELHRGLNAVIDIALARYRVLAGEAGAS